jgi:peptidoglycan/xylan/chitin deacetylase (PgdA/CDA1 family)
MAIRAAVRRLAHVFQAPAVLRWIHRNEYRILTYHRFPDLAGLERQCAHLREFYQPVSFADLRAGRIAPHAVAVTIDDGFYDVAAAAPVFARYEIPVMLYLVSGFLDGELWMWWNQLEYAFRNAAAGRKTVTAGGRPMTLPDVTEYAKALPNAEREQLIVRVAEALGVTLPDAPPPEYRPLTWDQVRALPANFSFGAHTRTHPILSRLPSRDDVSAEIRHSRDRIAHELSIPVPDFSYPNGQPPDIPTDAQSLLRELQFETAVTTIRGRNPRQANLLHLNRLSVEPTLPIGYFAEILCGIRLG